jgi:hypothetical protein
MKAAAVRLSEGDVRFLVLTLPDSTHSINAGDELPCAPRNAPPQQQAARRRRLLRQREHQPQHQQRRRRQQQQPKSSYIPTEGRLWKE